MYVSREQSTLLPRVDFELWGHILALYLMLHKRFIPSVNLMLLVQRETNAITQN